MSYFQEVRNSVTQEPKSMKKKKFYFKEDSSDESENENENECEHVKRIAKSYEM